MAGISFVYIELAALRMRFAMGWHEPGECERMTGLAQPTDY